MMPPAAKWAGSIGVSIRTCKGHAAPSQCKVVVVCARFASRCGEHRIETRRYTLHVDQWQQGSRLLKLPAALALA